MAMRRTFARLLVVFLPLGLTPLWGWLIAEGHLNFGGGEKDLLMLIPWLLWSLIYLAASVVLWIKGLSVGRATLWSAIVSTLALAIIFVLLYLFSAGFLGVNKS